VGPLIRGFTPTQAQKGEQSRNTWIILWVSPY
jgi:hypothetical protein